MLAPAGTVLLPTLTRPGLTDTATRAETHANLNYNPSNGPVVAPWMAWGPYYWSNGMLGRNDGFVWDCEDFSSDGTHPSSTFGQLKVATR